MTRVTRATRLNWISILYEGIFPRDSRQCVTRVTELNVVGALANMLTQRLAA